MRVREYLVMIVFVVGAIGLLRAWVYTSESARQPSGGIDVQAALLRIDDRLGELGRFVARLDARGSEWSSGVEEGQPVPETAPLMPVKRKGCNCSGLCLPAAVTGLEGISEKPFKVYIYRDEELPVRFRMSEKEYAEMRKSYLGEGDDAVGQRHVFLSKLSELVFLENLRNSPELLTDDPEEASMFFLPFPQFYMLHIRQDIDRKSTISFLKGLKRYVASGGLDHFAVYAQGYWGFRDNYFGEEMFQLPHYKLWSNAATGGMGEVVPQNIPIPMAVLKKERIDPVLWPLLSKRRHLIYFYGDLTIGNRGRMVAGMNALIRKRKLPEGDVVVRSLNKSNVQELRSISSTVKAAFAHAKLCPIPTGHVCFGKRVFNAIAVGCIPVLLASCWRMPFAATIPVHLYTYSIPDDQVGKAEGWEFLLDLTDEELEEKREHLKRAYHVLMWNYPEPLPGDAFHTAVNTLRLHRMANEEVLLRKRDGRPQSK